MSWYEISNDPDTPAKTPEFADNVAVALALRYARDGRNLFEGRSSVLHKKAPEKAKEDESK